jgi:hypothetical protein
MNIDGDEIDAGDDVVNGAMATPWLSLGCLPLITANIKKKSPPRAGT